VASFKKRLLLLQESLILPILLHSLSYFTTWILKAYSICFLKLPQPDKTAFGNQQSSHYLCGKAVKWKEELTDTL